MIGEVISKYRILEEIGSGAMGTVYKSQDTFLGRFAALKLIAEKYLDDKEAVARFEREGNAASALHHPNICTVFETGRWRGRPYLAMELLQGITLSQRIAAGAMDPGEVLRIAMAVAGALEAAHRLGIIHRDIKPANVFLTRNGQVKVLDFGLAKVRPHAMAAMGDDAPTMATFVTMPGTLLGTLAYMAPEQMLGEAVDGRADQYSLGVMLYEMASGRLPVRGSSPALAGGLEPVVSRMTAVDRAARYRDFTEIRAALERLKAATRPTPRG